MYAAWWLAEGDLAVLDGFSHVANLHAVVAGEVGDGGRDAHQLEVGAGGEAHFFGRSQEQLAGGVVKLNELLELLVGEAGVEAVLAGGLAVGGVRDGLTVGVGERGGAALSEVALRYAADLNEDVYAVEQWAGNFLLVIRDELRCTSALVVGVVEVAARAGVHGGKQHKVGGIGGLTAGATDMNHVVFERLA